HRAEKGRGESELYSSLLSVFVSALCPLCLCGESCLFHSLYGVTHFLSLGSSSSCRVYQSLPLRASNAFASSRAPARKWSRSAAGSVRSTPSGSGKSGGNRTRGGLSSSANRSKRNAAARSNSNRHPGHVHAAALGRCRSSS